jgi:hypothetical protein
MAARIDKIVISELAATDPAKGTIGLIKVGTISSERSFQGGVI